MRVCVRVYLYLSSTRMFVKMKMMRSPVLSRVPAPVSLRSVCACVYGGQPFLSQGQVSMQHVSLLEEPEEACVCVSA